MAHRLIQQMYRKLIQIGRECLVFCVTKCLRYSGRMREKQMIYRINESWNGLFQEKRKTFIFIGPHPHSTHTQNNSLQAEMDLFE